MCVGKPDRFGQFFNGIRRVAVNTSITCFISSPRRSDQVGRVVKLRHNAVERQLPVMVMNWRGCVHTYSSTSASGRIVRISKMEIIGRNRINKNRRVKKKPIVPMNIAQSHWEGWYIPHDDGK